MNNDLDFIKKYNVLFVEDDESIRKQVIPILEHFFGLVIVGENGADGYNKYCSTTEMNNQIHLIIADINMPIKNGIEMVKEIKKLQVDIPSILISAHNESEYMLEAIKIGVSRYILKPLNLDELLGHIKDVCQFTYNQENFNKLQLYKNELEQYLDIVNQVALISKTDKRGMITYVNDIFCEVSGYNKEQLIGKPHNVVRHPEVSKDIFVSLWETISAGQVWKGKIKNLAQDGNPYYVNANIFPVFYDDGKTVKEYMSVRFLITESEIERRRLKQRVIKNVVESKFTIYQYANTIDELTKKLVHLEDDNKLKSKAIDILHDGLNEMKLNQKKLKSNIISYEQTIVQLNEKLKQCSFEHVIELEGIIKDQKIVLEQLNNRLEIYYNKAIELQNTNSDKDKLISALNKKLLNQATKIRVNRS
ncbi:response regulator [Arcobacter sp. FWKO B]|uniref:response regulator n=1 Tax=Arcobacter sp. FWKO B TaxID=2593672 RepID=UPI0018A63FDD|nr:response regulator [Arcobacter sp. FWKO B]QOG12833.1 response regulator [Arcobacter sp. FWKO B]